MMRKVFILFLALIVTTVWMGMNQIARSEQPYSTQTGQKPETTTGTAGKYDGEHEMTGTIIKIYTSADKKDLVDVHTDAGTLTLHFPDASKNLREGSKITVLLGYKKATK
ncbi:MAG TPA: hypothetical protein VNM22_14610 [Candidatus Limnocylindrales bacterium]|nr:hypothetical protein [Candidatus Limnocylindrales bacterium]